MTIEPTLFISGASGKLGRRVVELLLERGYAGKIIAGSRQPETANFAGVETRKADFADPAGFTAALKGVDRLLLISIDVLGPERARLQVGAVAAAKAAGVKHIVYTSLPEPGPGSPIPFAAEHYATEEAIKASGLGFTILRNSLYAEQVLMSLANAVKSGKWFTAAGAGTSASVSREDCARAAAGALISAGENSILTVTGTAALTTRQVAALASEITGRSIEVVDVPDEALAAGARQGGVPEMIIANVIVPFDVNARQGRMSAVTDTVERLWGTKPQSLGDFLAANRAALVG